MPHSRHPLRIIPDSALQSEVLGTRRAPHRIRLHVINLYQMAGSAAPSTLRIAIRAPPPVPQPNVPLHRRRNRPRDGRPRAPAGHPEAAGSLCVVRLGRPSTTTVNLRPRRGLVRATINGRDRRGALVQAAISSSGRRGGLVQAAISSSGRRRGVERAAISSPRCRWRRRELGAIAVRAGALGIRCHRGGHALARALPSFRAGLWRSPAPRRLRVGRPRRRRSGCIGLVHTPVRARTRLRVVRLLRPSATTVNLHRRGGLVRVAISSSRRRCDLGAIAVGVGGLGIRCHDGGRALAGALLWFRAALWRGTVPRRLRVGRPRRRHSHSGCLGLVHAPVRVTTRLCVERCLRTGDP